MRPSLDLRLTRALSVQHRIVMFSKDNCCLIVERFISNASCPPRGLLYSTPLSLSPLFYDLNFALLEGNQFVPKRQIVYNFIAENVLLQSLMQTLLCTFFN